MQSIAAYLPVSDALGYYRCAISIGGLDQLDVPGVSDANWCSRRALYPAFLGSLLWLTLWRPSLVLIAQSAVIGLSLGLFVLVTARRLGWLVALTTATVVLVHAKEFALGNFMTESLGLPAGLLGLALLVHWEPDHDPWHRHLLAGVA
jgi:hypothetical protein